MARFLSLSLAGLFVGVGIVGVLLGIVRMVGRDDPQDALACIIIGGFVFAHGVGQWKEAA